MFLVCKQNANECINTMINRALSVENKQYQFLQRDHNICYRMVVFAFTLAAKNLSYTHQTVYSDIGLNNALREVRSKGVIPLMPHRKRRLARHKTHLRALVDKKVSQKKKETVSQSERRWCCACCFASCRFGRS